jgi:endonuclease/exonuclease/phosphatase family metal-dependent hydrolase
MRVVAWNMRGATPRSKAWEYLAELSPDVALLQEVGHEPVWMPEHFKLISRTPVTPSDKPQKFQTAIMVKGTVGAPIPLSSRWDWVNEELRRFHGNLVAHEVELHTGAAFRALSVYSPAFAVDKKRLAGVDVSEVKLTNNPDVWVTEILWAALQEHNIGGAAPWLVGGDLNASETFDLPRPRGNSQVLERMDALGLKECLRGSQGRLVPTFRHAAGGPVVHQMDHLFVSESMFSRLAKCEVGDDRVFSESLSDHLPIIADFT